MHLAQELKRRGVLTNVVPIEQSLHFISPASRVIAFLDRENLLLNADEHRLKIFQHLARHTTSMAWITSCGMVKGRSPESALVSGLLRTIGTEKPSLRFFSIDIDAEGFNVEDSDLVRCIADKQIAVLNQPSDEESEDREFVWQDDCNQPSSA